MRNLLLFFLLTPVICSAQDDSTFTKRDTLSYSLGDSTIMVNVVTYYSDSNLVFINLHHNEQTSIKAATDILEDTGGLFINIENYQQRNIKFSLSGKLYTFDPNRMFTKAGIIATLKANKAYSYAALSEVQKFAAYVISKIPHSSTLIALHNNTDKRFSILSYKKGGSFYKDAQLVHHNKKMDVDDFFITTDAKIYRALKKKNFNAVLQNNRRAKDDGSLSIYYGRRNKKYVNIEAEFGHYEEQVKMITTLLEIVTNR